LGQPGIRCTPPAGGVTYYHLLLPSHAVLLAENLPAESLLLGPMARAALSPAAQAELELLLPRLCWDATPALPPLRLRQGRHLMARHRKNALPLSL
ncbi:MAG TPA: Hint domain-containing protein, partial [Gemmobacter sp.]|nr:Hint domain-containing protein [Gemmobacter sp.]